MAGSATVADVVGFAADAAVAATLLTDRFGVGIRTTVIGRRRCVGVGFCCAAAPRIFAAAAAAVEAPRADIELRMSLLGRMVATDATGAFFCDFSRIDVDEDADDAVDDHEVAAFGADVMRSSASTGNGMPTPTVATMGFVVAMALWPVAAAAAVARCWCSRFQVCSMRAWLLCRISPMCFCSSLAFSRVCAAIFSISSQLLTIALMSGIRTGLYDCDMADDGKWGRDGGGRRRILGVEKISEK